MTLNYEKDTRLKYRDSRTARKYKAAYSVGFSFMKFATERIKKCVHNALLECDLSENTLILDMPCGTGFIAATLDKGHVIRADISMGMMALAREEYKRSGSYSFVQADATNTPFRSDTFRLVVNLGLMHRVPTDIKRTILNEIAAICSGHTIISFSITSLLQQLKIGLATVLLPHYQRSPSPINHKELMSEIEKAGPLQHSAQ